MGELLIVKGKVTTVDFVDRGRLLVYSAEEWKQRSRRQILWMYKPIIIAIAVVMALPFLIVAVASPEMISEPAVAMFMLIFVLGASLILILVCLSYIFLRDRVVTWPVPGVYENGIQLPEYPSSAFLPYSEIDSIEIPSRMSRLVLPKPVRLFPKARAGQPFLQRLQTPHHWVVKTDFLGSDGIAEVDRRVRGVVRPDGRPELIVYGASGGGKRPGRTRLTGGQDDRRRRS